jgi:hypothetical protein
MAMEAEPGIVPHFVPPGLTDLPQPPDRGDFGTLKADNPAISRMGLCPREDKWVTQADSARASDHGVGASVGSGDPARLRVPRL